MNQRQRELVKKFQEHDAALVREALEALAASEPGRAFLWWLLDRTECYSETDADNALALAKASGRREIAHALRAALHEVDPAAYGALLSWGAEKAAGRQKEIENAGR